MGRIAVELDCPLRDHIFRRFKGIAANGGGREMAVLSTINQDNIKVCDRCGIRYDWRRSPSSSLKMTYCGSLCERAALGFTIEALLRSESPVRSIETAEPAREVVAAAA